MAFGSKKSKYGLQASTAKKIKKLGEEVTFSERPDRTFNVKAFGAKGNGQADDWRALQQAIAFAYNKQGGGTLFFPPGLYRISEPLEVPEVDSENQTIVSWVGYSDQTTIIAPSKPMDYLVRMRGGDGGVKGIRFMGSDPGNGYVRNAKVCMIASDIRNKVFSNTSFSWGIVHGLQILEEGNNNLCIFDQSCKFEQNGKVLTGTDARGSGTEITFSSLNLERDNVQAGAFIKIGTGTGSVYHIDEVSGSGIKVSPKLKNTFRTGTEYNLHIGSGLQIDRGSDNNVYGIYDCHFVGNAGAGLVQRGLYGHNVQGGNFDSNGIAGIHIGSGTVNTTPSYSNTIHHAYFESNGYANVILDYPSGLSIIDPLLAKPVDGTGGGVDSITSLRNLAFDYMTTSIIYNGRTYQYVHATNGSFTFSAETGSRIFVNQPANAIGPAVIRLPAPPTHEFGEELEIFVEDSGGLPVQLVSDFAEVNRINGRFGIEVPAGIGFKITAFYSRRHRSWMVSHTTPLV
ncbi:MAG TPA: glycosyl hydrolase family 28-related protein [Planococcus sp. (in: firmicutes)]|nr:glycosyl hydrolase family 28-related protein [Planococcus sp. (in: firmicutes)]